MRLKPGERQIDCLRHEPNVQGWQGCSNQRESLTFNPILSFVALSKSGGKSDYLITTYKRLVTFLLRFLHNADYVGGAIKKPISKKNNETRVMEIKMALFISKFTLFEAFLQPFFTEL